MKTPKVIPLHRKGDIHLFFNYSPVSLEKYFGNRLDHFIEKLDHHYGFRSNQSTEMAEMELIKKISTALENKENTVGEIHIFKKALTQVIIDY